MVTEGQRIPFGMLLYSALVSIGYLPHLNADIQFIPADTGPTVHIHVSLQCGQFVSDAVWSKPCLPFQRGNRRQGDVVVAGGSVSP